MKQGLGPGFGHGRRGCARGRRRHPVAGWQLDFLRIAGARLIGEDAITLGIDVGVDLRHPRQRRQRQAKREQPADHGWCTRCTVNVTVLLCCTRVSPSMT